MNEGSRARRRKLEAEKRRADPSLHDFVNALREWLRLGPLEGERYTKNEDRDFGRIYIEGSTRPGTRLTGGEWL
jgi:hypothetical protein